MNPKRLATFVFVMLLAVVCNAQMMLRQSTARVISFGPFVSPSDGVTLQTGLVSAIDHASTGIMLSKNGGALTIRHATVTASTYDAYGQYLVTLDTTDTGTLGHLRVQFAAAASCLPVWQDFEVVPAGVWDSFMASSGGALPVNATAIGGTTQTGRDLGASVLISSGTGTGQLNVTSGVVAASGNWNTTTPPTVAAIATGVWQDATGADFTTASSIGKCLYIANVIPGAAGGHFIAGTNAATSITTALTANITGNVSGSVGSVTGAVGSVAGAVGSVTGAVGSVTSAVTLPSMPASWTTAIWQDATAGDFTTASSIGKCLYIANVIPGAAGGHFIAGSNSATTVNFTGNLSGSVGSVTGAVGSVTGAVGSVTGAVGSVTSGVTLAAPQHVIVDSGTVTTLTNLPAIPAGWLTANGIGAGALNGKGDWLLSSGYTAPDNTLTLTSLGTALDGRSLDATHLNRLDVAVSSVSAGGGLTQQQVADALKLAPTSQPSAAAGSVVASEQSILSAISSLPNPAGAGADHVTVGPFQHADGTPVADASVWITSDAAGLHVVAGTLRSNASGEATFLLNAGSTYYLFMTKVGETPIVGRSFVAEAD